MRRKSYKELWTVLLCTALFLTELSSAGSLAFAAQEDVAFEETQDAQPKETEKPNGEDGLEGEEKEDSVEVVEEPESVEGADEKEGSQADTSEKEESVEEKEDETQEEQIPDAEETEMGQDEENDGQIASEDEAGGETDESEAEKNFADGVQIGEDQAEAELCVQLASDDIASGSYKNITWVIDASGKLTVVGNGNVKDSKSHYVPWYEYRESIKSVEVRVTGMTSADGMFAGCSNLIDLDLSNFNTSKVTDMSDMFRGCSNLSDLDLSSFNTTDVTRMEFMFYGCSNLSSLDLSSFNTINVTRIGYMFSGCSNLSSLDLSNFNTSKVTDIRNMFYDCNNLTSLDLSSFNTTNVTDMSYMFSGCSNLSSLDLGSFNTANVTGMSGMFFGCSNLNSLDLSNFNTSKVTYMDSMFHSCSNLSSLDLSNFNTSKVTYMVMMFLGCSNLSSLDLSSFNTINVTDMSSMFSGCSNLSSLNLSSFNTTKVTGMGHMFYDCSNLSSLDLGSFNTTDVTNMESMFSGCSNLSSLDLGNFNTINVTRMRSMFSGCSNLGSLDLSSFNTSKITDMRYMFFGCSSLSSLELSSFDTSKVTDMGSMFSGCSNLSSLNLSSFNTSKVAAKWEIWDMFSLSTIYAPCGLKVSVELPTNWDSSFKEEWRLPGGTVVTELPHNLTRSVKLRKYRIVEQSPDEGSSGDQLKYVQNLTQTSLENADAESKKSIQNAIYNLLFKAEYRPMESKIPGDTMVYTGSREVIARWPIQNKDYGTPIFRANTVTDAKLGTITYNTSSAGCMSYACFATTYVYGTSGNCVWREAPNAESVRDFIRSYADPGEQLRYNKPHSIVFLGEDADGDGFYYISYNGGDDGEGNLYHDLYVGSYARYADFAAVIASTGGKLYIYDTNNGSYYNNTAASAAEVRGGKGAARIVTRLACPIEATIELNGEILDSRNPGSASFGTVARDGEEVVFTLDYSPDYRLTVTGTGEGGMTLTLEYYGEDETLIDRRRFVDMPIKTETEIESGGFDPQASFVLYKSDNMGEAEAWGAGIGETVYGANNIYRGDNASTPDNTPIITFDANGGTIGAEMVAFIATNEDAMITVLPEAVRDGYVFKGWYTSPMHGIKVDETRIYMENTTLYAQWEKTGGNTPGDNDPGDDTPGSDVPAGDIPEGGIPEGLWIAGIGDMAYTGRPVKPEVRVYDSDRRLKEGKDYTISYKNNTKAADAANSAKPATVVVKGKGNYTGTETATFNILPISLEDGSVTAQDLTVAYNGKVQKKAVTVMFNGKKLSAGKDFTVSYPALTQGVSGAYQEEGTYDILLTAKAGGNFSGTRTVKLTITKAALISKATVKKIPNQHYTGGEIMPKPTVTLKKATLTEGTDYTVSYDNNTEAGTATVVLTGIGAYAGTKRVTFKIIGTPLKGVGISGIETKVYNGAEQTQNISIWEGSVILEEDVDYELSYSNNKNAGKASVTIKGINAYTGTIKKTFQITAYDLKENSGSQVKGLDSVITAKYLKGGSRPTLELTFGDKTLIEGKDYTLVYKNNKAVTFANTVKKPVITIKGKGNFKGSLDKTFTIESKNLNDPEYPVKMSVADKSFINKAGKYISKPELTDADGKRLVAGKDYEKGISYMLEDGTALTGKSKVAAGTNVIVTVTGKGAYSGELKTSYRITKSDFNKTNIRIAPQIYTGKKITLDKDSVTVKIGKDTLSFGTDYEIVEGSYVNNTEKGTAKVKIVGKGNYGGTKTVSFRITARKFSWFFRLFQ